MKIWKKSHRVSWPPDTDLCQVRLFSSEDCPSQVAPESQYQLQEKTPWILHSYPMDSNRRLSGFQSPRIANSRIPKLNWKCPLQFVLSPRWQVTAGEESKEVESQRERESRVLEAVYPWSFSIPSSPSVSADVEESYYDDSLTPIVPLIPIEEDEDTSPLPNAPSSSPPPNPNNIPLPPCLDADITAAASAAYTAIMKSKEHGSLIDTNLLIHILTNPKLVQQLAQPSSPQVPASKIETKIETSTGCLIARDAGYYKSLVSKHGSERDDSGKGSLLCDANRKTAASMPACLFFNTSKGCRLGETCMFRHVGIPPSRLHMGGAKRMKL